MLERGINVAKGVEGAWVATVESCALFFSERRDARLAKLCVRHGAMNLWFMVMVARTRALAICQTFCRSLHTCGFANVSKHLFGSNSRSIDCVRQRAFPCFESFFKSADSTLHLVGWFCDSDTFGRIRNNPPGETSAPASAGGGAFRQARHRV